MNRSILNILFLSVMVVANSSCQSEDEKISKLALLTGKLWLFTNLEVDGEDATDDMYVCDTDNAITFKENGTFIEEIGTIKCYETEVNLNGTWKFKTNETIINIHGAGAESFDWKLVELTTTSLKISHSDADADVVMVFTAKK